MVTTQHHSTKVVKTLKCFTALHLTLRQFVHILNEPHHGDFKELSPYPFLSDKIISPIFIQYTIQYMKYFENLDKNVKTPQIRF